MTVDPRSPNESANAVLVPASPVELPKVGDVFDGKYLITNSLGEGGFGLVFEARDIAIGAPVAIKILRGSAQQADEMWEALQSEARQISRIKHPNIVDWKAFSQTSDGQAYFVMERLEGETLEILIRREGVVDPERAVPILVQILDALRAAHQDGGKDQILHLDLKPANIFLEPHPSEPGGDWVKLFDFGEGPCSASAQKAPISESDETKGVSDLTLRSPLAGGEPTEANPAAGELQVERVGYCTPNYAAPEQGAHLLADHVPVRLDHRCDLYSVGVIAFRMITGTLPFDGASEYEEVLRHKLVADPPSVATLAPGISRKLAAFVDRMLCRRREERFATTEEAYQELVRIASGSPRRWILGVSALFGIGGVLGPLLLSGGAAAPLDVVRDTASGPAPLGDATIHFGPRRAAVVVRQTSGASVAEVCCVRDTEDRGETVPWLSGSHGADGTVTLRSAAADARRSERVYLRFDLPDGSHRYSRPFTIVYLPAGSPRLARLEIPEAGRRAVEPRGLSAVLEVDLPSSDVAGVDADWLDQDGRVLAQLSPAEDGTGAKRTRFLVPLEGVDLPGGRRVLRVRVTDRAGGRLEETRVVEVRNQALQFTSCGLDAPVLGEFAVFGASHRLSLKVELNGRADIMWTMFHENGTRLHGGRSSGRTSFEIPIETALGNVDFEGRIEVVASDDRVVLRRVRERGAARSAVRFRYTTRLPNVTVSAGPSPDQLRSVDAKAPVVLRVPRVTLRVTRAHTMPMRVEIRTKATKPVRIALVELSTKAAESWQEVVQLPEGTSELELRVWGFLEGGLERAPDLVRRVGFLVDSRPPALAFEGKDERLVIGSEGVDPLTVLASDTGAGLAPQLEIELHTAAGLRVLRRSAPVASGRAPIPISVPDVSPDGDYELSITARDEAGNRAVLRRAVALARCGPVLKAVAPNGRNVWVSGSDGRFVVEVAAEDLNGVRDVAVEFRTSGHEPVVVPLQRVSSVLTTQRTVWRAAVRPRRGWSETELVCRIRAADSHGNESNQVVRQRVGAVRLRRPRHVDVLVGGDVLARLSLVSGNKNGDYLLGGRGDQEENALFRKFRMPPFHALSTQRSWRLRVPAGKILDFYLATTETTVGAFRRFLQDANGYSSADNWRSGGRPVDARKRELQERLQGLDARLPTTDIDWNEAKAFATWCGLRLMTLGEAEYAIRGGLRYRPFSFAGEGPSFEEPEVHLLGAAADKVPWPVLRGADLVPGTQLRNLSTNVSEWTETVRAVRDRRLPRQARVFFQVSSSEDLSAAERFWSIGASLRDETPAFTVSDVRRRHYRASWLGFRCALDARAVNELLDKAPSRGVSFRAAR